MPQGGVGWKLPDGQGGAGGSNPGPSVPTTPAPINNGPVDWNNLSQIQKDYYNDPSNYAETEDLYFRSLGLTGNALQYAKQQAQAIKARYGQFALANPTQDSPFTSWLSQGGSQSLINGYNMLSARNRGANPGLFSTGRMMF